MKKESRFLPVTLSTLALALVMPATLSADAVSYAPPGSLYMQNFNTLSDDGSATPDWTNGDTLRGWHWVKNTGDPTPTAYRPTSTTSAVQSQILSLGKLTADTTYIGLTTDRALGAQNSNGIQDIYYGLQLANNTGFTLGTFTLTYTGEQWRAITNEVKDRLTFSYKIFASGTGSLTAADWTNVAALDFIAPKTVTSSTGLDGNLAENRTTLFSTVNGITWADGQELWLRWNDNNPVNDSAAGGSTRASMGIDDVSFTAAIPEPTAPLLLGLGAFLLGLRRRR